MECQIATIDAEDPVEMARQGRDAALGQNHRIDLMVRDLDRYDVVVATLQETKWMGSNVYHVGGSVVLATGRQVPGPGVPLQRGEGVAQVLSGLAVGAWQEAGKLCKAWSSRLISTHLQI